MVLLYRVQTHPQLWALTIHGASYVLWSLSRGIMSSLD
jgi:hypothetical protein